MYFAVRQALKIDNKKYFPGICYKLTRDLSLTIDELVKEDKAFLSEEYMVFESGKVVSKPKKVVQKKQKKEA